MPMGMRPFMNYGGPNIGQQAMGQPTGMQQNAMAGMQPNMMSGGNVMMGNMGGQGGMQPGMQPNQPMAPNMLQRPVQPQQPMNVS